MTAGKLVLLGCASDAKEAVERGLLGSGAVIATSQGSAADYLRLHGISSVELSSLVDDEFIRAAFAAADRLVEDELRRIDATASDRICAEFNLPRLALFHTLYRYYAKTEYLNMRKVAAAVRVLRNSHFFDAVTGYAPSTESVFAGGTFFAEVIGQATGLPVELAPSHAAARFDPAGRIERYLRQAWTARDPVMAVRSRLREWIPVRVRKDRKTVLLLGKLYNLAFLPDSLSECNVIHWSSNDCAPRNLPWHADPGAIDPSRIETVMGKWPPTGDPLLDLLVRNIRSDFLVRCREYLSSLLVLRNMLDSCPVQLVVWGQSPAWSAKSLLVQYCLDRGMKVLGMQHGASVGDQFCHSCHFDTDFTRATHFLSFGFSDSILRKTYPGREVPCRVIPAGSRHVSGIRARARSSRSVVDMVFPMTNSMPITIEGLRIRSCVLNQAQRRIAEWMERQTDLKMVIKPFPGYSEKDCSITETLRRLRRVRCDSGVSTAGWLMHHRARAIVIEYPSTPLYEMMGEDADILLLTDPILPFSEHALELLKKRVHVFDDVDNLLDGLEKWKRNLLPRLRDGSFLDQYVTRSESGEIIVKAVRSLLID